MENLYKHYRSLSYRQRLFLACSIAVIATVVIMTGFSVLFPTTAFDHPFLISFFPVIICAFIFGYRPGFASLITSTLYTDYFLIAPYHSLKIAGNEVGSDLGFIALGLIVIWLIKQQRMAQAGLVVVNRRLEEALAQRERELKELTKAHGELSHERKQLGLSADQLRDSNRRITAILEKILKDSER